MRIIYLIVLLSVFHQNLMAVQLADSIQARLYFSKADSLDKIALYDSANHYFRKALELYEIAGLQQKRLRSLNRVAGNYRRLSKYDESVYLLEKIVKESSDLLGDRNSEQAYAFNILGLIYKEKGANDKALKFLEQALEINQEIYGAQHLEVCKIYNNLGIVYKNLEKFEQAADLYNKALAITFNPHINDSLAAARILSNLAVVYKNLGYYDLAFSHLHQCIKILKNNKMQIHPRIVIYYGNLGNVYLDQGSYETALSYYLQALNILKQTNNIVTPTEALLWNNIGLVYQYMDQLNLSKDAYLKALDISKAIFGEIHYRVASWYSNLGGLYYDMGNYAISLGYLKQSLAIYHQIYSHEDNEVAEVFERMGKNYQGLGLPELALKSFTEALESRKKIYGNLNHDLASSFNYLGKFFLDVDSLKAALNYFQQAIMANCPDFDDPELHSNPGLDDPLDQNILLQSMRLKAQTLSRLGAVKSDHDQLQRSLEAYQLCHQLVESIRRTHQKFGDKVTLGKEAHQLYKGAITLCFQLFDLTQDHQYLVKAFEFSERSKSGVLTEAYTVERAKHYAGIPDSLLVKEKHIKADISYNRTRLHQEQLKEEKDENEIRYYQDRLFTSEREYEALTHLLETNYPQYHKLKYSHKEIDVPGIQKSLGKTTDLLEYFIGDSSLYLFVINQKGLSAQKVLLPKDLGNKIQRFRRSITDHDKETYESMAYQLYQRLLQPVTHKLTTNRLIIIPDGPLWYLNLDILLTDGEKGKDYKELPYVLKEYSISYAYSANFIVDKSGWGKELVNPGQCLAFSFTDSSNLNRGEVLALRDIREAEGDLPGTRREIKAISQILEGEYYYGTAANESNFRKKGDAFGILHLALHGEVDNRDPANSRLYFSPTADSLEDNQLFAHELYNMNLPAELAVLSACNSGKGEIADGEGILSLGQAFSYAGVKSLVVSLWEVDDASAPSIMEALYKNLKAGLPKDEALRRAKLQYLEQASAFQASPFHWAGFVTIGNIDPIEFDDSPKYYWIILGLVGLVMGVFVMVGRRKWKANR